LPSTQEAVALAGTTHGWQLPQWSTSVFVSTHVPSQHVLPAAQAWSGVQPGTQAWFEQISPAAQSPCARQVTQVWVLTSHSARPSALPVQPAFDAQPFSHVLSAVQ